MAARSSFNLDGRTMQIQLRERDSLTLVPDSCIQFASETLAVVHGLSLYGPCPVHDEDFR